MTDSEKSELRDSIKKQLKDLEKTIESLTESTQPVAPDVSLGRLTRMDAINMKGIHESNLRDARSKKQGLESTLKRLDEPDFGQCVSCGSQIPVARIVAVPESNKCVNCA